MQLEAELQLLSSVCIWSSSSGLPPLCSLARQPGGAVCWLRGGARGRALVFSREGRGSITHHRAEWLGENVAFGKLCWAVNPAHTPVSFVPVTARAQSGWESFLWLPKAASDSERHMAVL